VFDDDFDIRRQVDIVARLGRNIDRDGHVGCIGDVAVRFGSRNRALVGRAAGVLAELSVVVVVQVAGARVGRRISRGLRVAAIGEQHAAVHREGDDAEDNDDGKAGQNDDHTATLLDNFSKDHGLPLLTGTCENRI
jgi:hypothetical protein